MGGDCEGKGGGGGGEFGWGVEICGRLCVQWHRSVQGSFGDDVLEAGK